MAASEARPGVGAAQVLAHAGVPLREALHVQLVDDRLVPRRLERPVALPVEAGVDDDAARHRGRVVGQVGHLVASGRPAGTASMLARSQRTPPSIALAYGSSSSLAGLKRCPRSGAYGPCTR